MIYHYSLLREKRKRQEPPELLLNIFMLFKNRSIKTMQYNGAHSMGDQYHLLLTVRNRDIKQSGGCSFSTDMLLHIYLVLHRLRSPSLLHCTEIEVWQV
jgi:hypothetical protein